ncbi:Hypothetical protein AT6N2_L1463 [Agrobacterium tumefaciens]|nr:Hypothetical protein AT6N2_L1463 [Agrobacterium tumefaciens]
MHCPECRLGTRDNPLFLFNGQRNFVQCGSESAPVQAASFRCAGQMPRTEFFSQAKLGRILQQEGRAEIGAFDHVKPTHGLRQIKGRFGGKARCGRFWNGKTEIGKVLLDHGKTTPALEVWKQAVKCFIGKKDIEIAVEEILCFDKFAEVLAALKRLCRHDESIQIAMRAPRRCLQALDAALLDRCYRRCRLRNGHDESSFIPIFRLPDKNLYCVSQILFSRMPALRWASTGVVPLEKRPPWSCATLRLRLVMLPARQDADAGSAVPNNHTAITSLQLTCQYVINS